jgi:ATP synthase F1 delta subunit
MFATKLVHNYSEAILEASYENTSQITAELKELNKLIDKLKNLYSQRLFNDKLGYSAIIDTAQKFNFNQIVINLLSKLIKKHHLDILPFICDYLPELINKKAGILLAEVKSVDAISADDGKNIRAYLKDNLDKTFEIKNTLDKSLLGGITVSFDSFLLDASLINKLNKAKKYLSKYKTRV